VNITYSEQVERPECYRQRRSPLNIVDKAIRESVCENGVAAFRYKGAKVAAEYIAWIVRVRRAVSPMQRTICRDDNPFANIPQVSGRLR